jgi:hypothetical protein
MRRHLLKRVALEWAVLKVDEWLASRRERGVTYHEQPAPEGVLQKPFKGMPFVGGDE